MTAVETQVVGGVTFAPRRLGHANIWVNNLNRSISFYRKVVGLGHQATEVDANMAFLTNGNTHHDIALIERTRGVDRIGRDGEVMISSEHDAEEAGLFHLGWEMATEAVLVSAYRRALDANIEIPLLFDHQISRSVYVTDPDGMVMEFYSDSVKDWRRLFSGDVATVTSQWNPLHGIPSAEANYDPDPDIEIQEDALAHPKRIIRTVLRVSDLERSLKFFTTVCGLKPTYIDPKGRFCALSGDMGEYNLALIAAPEGKGHGIGSLCFEMKDGCSYDQTCMNLEREGIEIVRKIDDNRKKSIFINDPDGILLELVFSHHMKLGEIPEMATQDTIFWL